MKLEVCMVALKRLISDPWRTVQQVSAPAKTRVGSMEAPFKQQAPNNLHGTRPGREPLSTTQPRKDHVTTAV